MGRVDDGGELVDVVHAEVRDAEGVADVVLRRGLVRPRPLDQLLRLLRDLLQRLLVGVVEHRHDQAVRKPDRDPDVDVALALDPAVRPGGVDLGELGQGKRHRLDDQVVDADRLRLVDRLVEHLAKTDGIVHRDFRGDVEMRGREGTLDEAHGDGRLQLGQLDHLDLAGGTRRWLPLHLPPPLAGEGRGGGGRALRRGLYVFLLDPPTRAGPLDAAQVDAEFFGETPGDGGDALALAVFLLSRAANDIQGGLRRRTNLGSVVRPAVR